ncbi:PREDICTED: halilectin 3, beta chain-like [Amphimedon queenslandica]|uniref:Lipocalin/cytosolic fatty-acid binding domain-containing protein n=1 Tax=Amphimedon queenslandica TaxID=400682 RepID=A0A1X7U0V2_AMPQE|nr:PREDICTED: halilectin 3, beta chain-like [Amphimedon queenslandica]|eukprot:XP_019856688.1 PREDICTED: halilectin 3, beta chain-like [Amphimedon queenslandica]
MKCLLMIVAAAALLGIASAAATCLESPPIWSGHLFEISTDNPRRAVISYSRDEKKIKTTDYKGVPLRTTLDDYTTGTRYVSENGECRKSNLTGTIPTFGVPEGSLPNPVGPHYLGGKLPDTGVLVYDFYGENTRDGIYFLTYAPVGEGTVCVPLYFTFLAKPPLLQEFTELVTTVPPGAFSIPPGCE